MAAAANKPLDRSAGVACYLICLSESKVECNHRLRQPICSVAQFAARLLPMKLCFALLGLLALSAMTCAQTRNAQARTSTGSICIAAPDRPTAGEKSLANPAGRNRISTYSIQVDRLPATVASNDRAVRIASISSGRKHLVKIVGDGKVVQSFWFSFSTFHSTGLCLWFNSLYETWSLWEAKEAGAKCKCR